MIYFAQLPTGAIKIGKTGDVNARLAQLEREFQGQIALLRAMPGNFKEETEMHCLFQHLRIRGEEFRPAPDLLEFIGRPLLVGANPNAIETSRKFLIVRLELPIETHRALRIEAARQEVSMARLARIAVEQYLQQRKRKD
jgi:Meiotically up-regulated gene 113